ncbi:hypothetical protein NDU88_007909 [Pleurodeles waltl]|uniref:Uncharacterized protein n=1 Tax=Pleurodeles waltl TaxID=8319 RepID=A0AAV7NXL5_PLEWA|nr:hypothetical protein NDU88_007909 [Pleurodeles waltl]
MKSILNLNLLADYIRSETKVFDKHRGLKVSKSSTRQDLQEAQYAFEEDSFGILKNPKPWNLLDREPEAQEGSGPEKDE